MARRKKIGKEHTLDYVVTRMALLSHPEALELWDRAKGVTDQEANAAIMRELLDGHVRRLAPSRFPEGTEVVLVAELPAPVPVDGFAVRVSHPTFRRGFGSIPLFLDGER